MKVAIVHDDLMQWGGAERVLLGICELFPEAPIYTLIYDRQNEILKNNFAGKKIITSFLQKLPLWKDLYKPLFFLHPLAFEQFDFSGYDLVISQTTRFAKSIITKPETVHICYCHTPPRFLWHFSGEKVPGFLSPFLSWLRVIDRVSAQKVDLFLAGSENAKKRIDRVYQKDSEVLLPFIGLENFQVQGFEGGYYLIIARLNDYKRVDLAVQACKKLNLPLKVLGKGPEMAKLQSLAGPNLPAGRQGIEFVGGVSEAALLSLISGAKALIVTGEEDFGLTPLEAQAFGKPVIAFGQGGVLETVIEGKTGIFFQEQTAESLIGALNEFEKKSFDSEDCKNQARKFSKSKFQQRLLNLVSKACLSDER